MKRVSCKVLFALMLVAFSAAAQRFNPNAVSKKAMQLYQQALQQAENEDYQKSLQLLKKATETDNRFADAWLAMGTLYGKMKNYKLAAEHLEQAFRIDSQYCYPYYYNYAHYQAGLGAFDRALQYLNRWREITKPKNPEKLKEAEARRKSYEFALHYAAANPDKGYVFAPRNLGPKVNSSESEYFPSLTLDGSQLVFTRNLGGKNEDFFGCVKSANGEWNTAQPLQGVNTPLNEGAQFISSDGLWLVFTACYRKDGMGSCDIYISYKTPGGWSAPVNLGRNVNTEFWESQPCLSPDKKYLYFVSSRPGGMGGSDIYVSRILPDGRCTPAENLGPAINTAGDEQCPFLHADNQTFYFTSDARPGYGDDDLYMVKKLPDGKWSEALNLGYPINTIDKEGTLFIAADGKTAYYASDRSDSYGGMDIYTFELRQQIRPVKTLWIKGKVFDRKTKKGLSASVQLTELKTGLSVAEVNADEQGHFLITLPTGKDYVFNVSRKGYLFYSDQFLLAGKSPDSVYQKDIPLTPIEKDAAIVLKNIFFDFNKAELRPESETELNQLVTLLTENPGLKVEISGHTDNVGRPTDNMKLSQNRARAVVNYLAAKGISPDRLIARGYGETRPVANNKTEAGRAQNRRTELKIIGF
ncbi:MAG: OmpA family protein [Chitinophagaceae bacterium]|nr:OmpA family protein [Chitinophagaceae bacterium]